MKTDWDYTERAHTYDQRADYSSDAVKTLLHSLDCSPNDLVADIGAGTGKLTKLLLDFGLQVIAVEPNDNMRSYGIKNTKGLNVTWREGIGEDTGLDDHSVQSVFFGSSFNVVDQSKTLIEASRILKSGGWFSCMWNHRDTSDTLQSRIESIIHENIPNYNYGSRRQDPSSIIESSGLFGTTACIERRFLVNMSSKTIVEAWKSHDTLYRQSEGKFDKIIEQISQVLTKDSYSVPYFSRIWYAQLLK